MFQEFRFLTTFAKNFTPTRKKNEPNEYREGEQKSCQDLPIKSNSKRIEYIDALRGFTIILVIHHHILTFGINQLTAFDYDHIFVSFRMPLFFFISGFVLFKENIFRTKQSVSSFLTKKAKVQILPTLFFLVIYMYIFQKGTMEIIGSPFKGGYWFTLILFAYFYMYSIGDYLLSVLRFNTKQRLMVLFATSLIIYVLCTNPVLVGGRMAHILSLSQFRYFCFFVFGTIVKFQYDKVKDLFKNNYVSTSIVLGFLISTLIAETVRINSEWVMQTLKFIQSYCGVLLVFMFFEKNQNWCSKDTKIGNWLQYVGKRTLDIYLIHYFFLPSHWSFIDGNPTLNFFICLFMAILVLIMSIVTSNLLRCSDFLTEWLFGRKKKSTA